MPSNNCFIPTLILLTCLIAVSLAQIPENFITMGDSAYRAFDHRAAMTYYQSALDTDTLNDEAAWKLCRAYVDVGEGLDGKDVRKQYYLDARKFADRAIRLNPDNAAAYLWRSITLGRVALDAGAKERVRLAKDIREAVEHSLALDSTNAIAWHVLGRWHRKIATLNWIERGFANIFLGGIPRDATVEHAAECFEKAVRLDPEAVVNHLELGITYEKLKRKADAITAYKTALALPIGDSDDQRYKEEAQARLRKL